MFVEMKVHPPPGGRITMDQPRFFRELSIDESPSAVGSAVLDALDANCVEPDLDYPTDILDTVYAAGLKSYGEFTRGAKYVSVVLENESTRVEVGVTDGTRHAGSFIGTGEYVRSDSLSSDSVGAAVLQALQRSLARPAR